MRSVAAYTEAKARIFANQTAEDWAGSTPTTPGPPRWPTARGHASVVQPHPAGGPGGHVADGWVTLRLGGRDTPVCPVGEITLRGDHNLENVLAVTVAAAWAGAAPERLRAAIPAFRAVPHRLESVRELSGVAFCTTPRGRTWTPR